MSPVVVKDTPSGGIDWIADVNKGRSMAEVVANAALIAQSPAMYSWLKRMAPSWDEEARGIIAKIEGGAEWKKS